MNDILVWALMPVLGALIGWITNVIAIRMLFRPKKIWRFPGTSWQLQGVIPRRQNELARAISETVTTELLPVEDLLDRLNIQQSSSVLTKFFTEHMEVRVREMLGKLLPEPFKELLAARLMPRIREMVENEAGAILQEAIGPLKQIIKNELKMGEIIEQKVREFDLDDLERIIYRVVGQELRHIEVLGAILGFLIGVFQSAIVVLLQ